MTLKDPRWNLSFSFKPQLSIANKKIACNNMTLLNVLLIRLGWELNIGFFLQLSENPKFIKRQASYWNIVFFLFFLRLFSRIWVLGRILIIGQDFSTHFISLSKFSVNSDNFWPELTFQIRVKYRKMVFGPKPELHPVLLRDLDESRSYAPAWPYASNLSF